MLRKILFSLFLLSPALMCQVTTGTVSGAITDSSGAALSDARIQLRHLATGETREVEANERGEFNAPFLRVGEYSMTVSAPGFRTAAIQPVSVRVDQTVNLPVTLAVGAVNESVEVTASTPLLDASTSSVGQVIENKKIIDLPLNGRNPFALGLLAGNTVPMSGMGTNLPFVAGGGRFPQTTSCWTASTTTHRSTRTASVEMGSHYTPSVDAVEEFKVKTNNYSAEFGRSAGAIISATTRSGGNQYHGSAWDFLRNEKLDANNFFSNAGGVPGSLSSRINLDLPPADPYKSLACTTARTAPSFSWIMKACGAEPRRASNVLDIPPLAYRPGRFFSLYRSDLRSAHSTNWPERTSDRHAVSEQSDSQRVAASGAVAVLGLLPEPNFGAPGADARNYLRIASSPYNNDQYDIKIDQRFGDKNTLFGRVSRSMATEPNPGSFDGFIGGGGNNIRNAINSVINDTHIFSSTDRQRVSRRIHTAEWQLRRTGPTGVDFARTNNIALFPFPVQVFRASRSTSPGLVNTQSQFTGLGGGDPNINIENTYQLSDNVSIIRGNHAFKTGVDARRYLYDVIRGGGQYIFGSILAPRAIGQDRARRWRIS